MIRTCSTLSILLLAVALGTACSTNRPQRVSVDQPGQRNVPSLGITISGLRLSSAGYMLDFRYRVTEPEKAAILMKKGTRLYLFNDSTGEKLEVPDTPKLGMLRQRPSNEVLNKNHEYFALFANLGRRLKSGDKVSVMIGDTKIENLIIQ
jgi:hypothetical protein